MDTLAFYAVNRDGHRRYLSQRPVRTGETVDLHAEAREAMDHQSRFDAANEGRIVRDEVPLTVSVQADLLNGSTLVDRDEAFR